MGLFNYFKTKERIKDLESQVKTFEEFTTLVGHHAGKRYETILGPKLDYNSHFAIQKCIQLKSNLVAQVPMKLFQGEQEMDFDSDLKLYGGGKINLKYPALDMSWNELLRICLIFYYYRGEMFIKVNREDNYIKPLNPIGMRRINNKSDDWTYDIGAVTERIDSDELIYIKQLNPDTYDKDARGNGLMHIIDNELENDLHALRYSNSFWKNFTIVGGRFQVREGAKITPKMLQAFIADWNLKNRGTENSGKTEGIPKGLEYIEPKHSINDSDLLPLRKDTTERILAAQGVHKSLLGFTDQVNRSVAEESIRQLWKLNLHPDAIMLQEKLNQQLMRNFLPGYRIEFDFSQIPELQSINSELFEQAKKLRELGYTTSEINVRLGLGFDDNDDEVLNTRFVPNNIIPYSMYTEQEPEPEPKKTFNLEDLIPNKSIEVGMTKTPAGLYINKYNLLLAKSAKPIISKVGKVFSKQLVDISKLLYSSKKAIEIDINKFLKDLKKYLEKNKEYIGDKLNPIYETVSKEADKLALSYIKLAEDPISYADVTGKMINRIKGINDTTYNIIKANISGLVEEGATIDELADSLKGIIKDNAARRRIIARTESAGLINQSTDKRYRDYGIKKKEWHTVGDHVTRDSHATNQSAGKVKYEHVYANGQKFPNDGVGGASENVNCRCCLLPVIE